MVMFFSVMLLILVVKMIDIVIDTTITKLMQSIKICIAKERRRFCIFFSLCYKYKHWPGIAMLIIQKIIPKKVEKYKKVHAETPRSKERKEKKGRKVHGLHGLMRMEQEEGRRNLPRTTRKGTNKESVWTVWTIFSFTFYLLIFTFPDNMRIKLKPCFLTQLMVVC